MAFGKGPPMSRCPSCSADQPDGARFCNACGGRISPPPQARVGVRKIVTVLFCDLVESTALGGRLDAETVRTLMLRYYAAMRACVERHGGAVEKFVGDAVMAVFGIPAVHEDDALRAVRAALEMRGAVAALNADLRGRLAFPLDVRIGVNTGEVIATVDDLRADTLVSGDVVNIAARLEQGASPGEILIGQDVYRLTRETVATQETPPLAAKGVGRPLPAWRVLGLAAPSLPARRVGFHGRALDLALLENCLARSARHRSFQLCTVYGEAGMGKTRLAEQVLSKARAAGVHGGIAACPAYGAQGTLLALVCAMRQAALSMGREVCELLPGPLAEGAVGAARTETFTAVRRALESLCETGPVLLVLDDVHWADASLLDLIDLLALRMKNSPLTILCLTRIELLERRPDWSGGRLSATSLTLAPFAPGECEALGRALLRHSPLDERVLSRCAEASMGNPFFLEQFLQTESERQGSDDFPLTVQSVVAARLDRLSGDQRAVLEWAAVTGHTFSYSVLEECCGHIDGLRPALEALDDKLLVRRAGGGEDEYEFCGRQIHDICYAAIAKTERAHRHRALGDVYTARGDPGGMAGHHYRSALLYWEEVLYEDEEVDRVRVASGTAFLRFGRAGLALEDLPRAEAALRRAVEMLRLSDGAPAREATAMLMDTVSALGDSEAALGLADDLVAEAERVGDTRLACYGRMERVAISPTADPLELERTASAAARICALEGDRLGQVRAWMRLGQAAARQGRQTQAGEHFARAARDARRTPGVLGLPTIVGGLAYALRSGNEDCARAIEACEDLLAEFAAGGGAVRATIGSPLAELLAMRGRFAEAHARMRESIDIIDDLGYPEPRAAMEVFQMSIALLERDVESAVYHAEQAENLYRKLGVVSPQWLANQTARVLLEAGRIDEAADLIEGAIGARRSGEASSTAGMVSTLSVHARILAARSRFAQAVESSARAEALTVGIESLSLRATVFLDRALIAARAGDAAERDRAGARARALFRRKGHLVGAGWAETLCERDAV
jgi:class 3 adenylate cyclase/tetratricopeptide (TPR) repeat protein